jgi:predicted DsbA family dithiol-disulfide isomerase
MGEPRPLAGHSAELGIRADPFLVLGDVYSVSGAQPVEVLHQALVKAMAEAPQRAIIGQA